jgi:SAM-dependent methyltransferase
MRRFWDRRAREDAFFFVDSRREPGDTEVGSFWDEGESDLARLFDLLEVAIKPTDTIVEIGCGVGRLTRVLARRGRRVIALDVSEDMLARARRHNPGLANVDWRLGDGVSLAGIADGIADVCVSHVVFQHIPDPGITLGYIREIGRVLRPGGWAAVQVSTDPRMHVHPDPLRERLRALLGRAPRGRTDPAWLGSAVRLEDVRRAATEGGLDLEAVWGEGTQFCQLRLRRTASAA